MCENLTVFSPSLAHSANQLCLWRFLTPVRGDGGGGGGVGGGGVVEAILLKTTRCHTKCVFGVLGVVRNRRDVQMFFLFFSSSYRRIDVQVK